MTRQFLIVAPGLMFLSCGSVATDNSPKDTDQDNTPAYSIKPTDSEVTDEVMSPIDAENFYRTAELYDKKIKMLIPRSFTEMSDEKVQLKYANARSKPDIVFTNERASVNLTFTHTLTKGTEGLLPDFLPLVEAQIKATNPENFKSRTESINGHSFIVLEFISNALDTKVYNLMFVTDLDSRLLIGTFNCTVELQREWEGRGEEMLASVKKQLP